MRDKLAVSIKVHSAVFETCICAFTFATSVFCTAKSTKLTTKLVDILQQTCYQQIESGSVRIACDNLLTTSLLQVVS